ncbi:hypothetical protein ELG75_07375 [Rhizobium leguminosarum]|nr:hypothetical protein ELG81_07360 [Rhizobium leguminosarum]TBG46293.1 hypothetical protein ELG75_07375 [Rhizobium leguminosarum]TBG79264.1 hypothetical protein ELG76_07710 [Rhizobium leguminosarum]
MWSPFVLSKQTESQLADFTQLFFGQALRFQRFSRGLWRIALQAANCLPYALSGQVWRLQLSLAQCRRKP